METEAWEFTRLANVTSSKEGQILFILKNQMGWEGHKIRTKPASLRQFPVWDT